MSDIFMIGNYGFQLIGKKTMGDTKHEARGRELMKNAPMVMYYVATYNADRIPVLTTLSGRKRTPPNQSGKPLIFAVYMSESQMGFCRLASFKLGAILLNKGPDYAQSSLINFNLGNFILHNLNHPSIIQYPFTDPAGVIIGSPYPDETFSDAVSYYDYLLEPNVVDKARIKGVIAPVSEKCGEMTPRISSFLEETSHSLQTNFPTMVHAEFVCNHEYSTSLANVEGPIFKVVLQSSDLSKYIEIFVYKYTVKSENLTGEAFEFSGTIPVLVKEPNPANPEDITEVGTYANYIPTGAYVCKLFEYNLQLTDIMKHNPSEEEKETYATQVTSKIIKVNDQYSFVGQLFNGLYPSSQLETFLKSQGQGGAHQKKHKPKPTRRHRHHRHHRRTRTPKKSRKSFRKK